jgi:ankyrin repeat protein
MMGVRTLVLGNALEQSVSNKFRTAFASPHWIEEGRFTILHKIVLGISERDLTVELAKGLVPVDAQASCGSTALCFAALKGNVTHINLLAAYGADLNAEAFHGLTPVKFACMAFSPEGLRALLKSGADPNGSNGKGFSPLVVVTSFMRPVSHLLALLDGGAEPNMGENSCALFWAAKLGQEASVRMLLERGADPDATAKFTSGRDVFLKRPLEVAIRCKFHGIVRELLIWGANARLIADEGRTILHCVAESADVAMIQVVKDASIWGIDVNARDARGRTAMMVFEERNSQDQELRNAFRGLLLSITLANSIPRGDSRTCNAMVLERL